MIVDISISGLALWVRVKKNNKINILMLQTPFQHPPSVTKMIYRIMDGDGEYLSEDSQFKSVRVFLIKAGMKCIFSLSGEYEVLYEVQVQSILTGKACQLWGSGETSRANGESEGLWDGELCSCFKCRGRGCHKLATVTACCRVSCRAGG